MFVKSLYRIGTYGVLASTLYDTEKGILEGVPSELFSCDTEGIEYTAGNYNKEAVRVSNTVLYEMIMSNYNIGAVIDYCNVGTFMCMDKYRYVQLLAGGRMLYEDFEKPQFNTEKILIGIFKQKPRTLSVEPFYTFIYYLPEYGKVVGPTGFIDVECKEGLPNKSLEYAQTFEGLKACLQNTESMGQIVYNGQMRQIVMTDSLKMI